MGGERHVKLFRNGRNRAVRIPREFDTFGDEVVMRQDGQRLVIEPARARNDIGALLDKWREDPPLGPDEEFPEIEDLPAEPFDL
jgi:antitoxin VapB